MIRCPKCNNDITKLKKFKDRRYIRGFNTEKQKYEYSIFCNKCYPYEIPTLNAERLGRYEPVR